MQRAVALTSIATVAAQKAGGQTPERHPKLSWKQCSGAGSCQSQNGEVVIDSNWRWTHKQGDTTNCYTGNTWDQSICPDSATCSSACVVEGADQEYTSTYGVQASGDKLTLGFVTQGPYSKNIGSRTYLMAGEDKYQMFKLKNHEFTYTVDDSTLDCGLNGALYFVAMDEDGGKSKYGHAGAKLGLGYCDAQCPHDLKWINGEANIDDWKPSETDPNAGTGKYGSCCTEIDIWEANKISTAYTMHACETDGQTRCSGTDCGDNGPDRFKGVCDKNGCDIQSYRLGTQDFWGPGSSFKIDSTKPVTVTTRFITSDGTDSGELKEVKQFYTQDGRTIEHGMYTVNGNQHNSVTDEFCADWVAETQDGTNFLDKGGMNKMGDAMEKGVVLVMSLWDDHYANMLWLDSTYPVDSSDPGAARGSCSTSSGVPKDVESQQANSKVKFSDIRFGPIGSTTDGPSPSPSPSPSPTPTPSPIPSAGCCSWAKPEEVQECGDTTAYCKASAENCVQCDGHWIHPVTPTPSPTPTPPSPAPTPTPSGCPGGSLTACIDLCPAEIFAQCAESCSKRCAHAQVV